MALDPSDAAGLPDDLIALYSNAELALITMLAEAIVEGIDTPEWWARQDASKLRFRRQAEALASQLQAQMPAMVTAAVAEAAAIGTEAADADLEDVPDALPKPPARGQDARTVARQREAWSTLATVTQRLPGVAGELYGAVVAQVQVRNREAAPSVMPRTGALHGAPTPEGTRLDAAQQALDILTKRGITGFKDARGRNWSLSSYVEMKSRTIVNQELIDSHTQRMRERGQSLIVVSSHKNPAPQCQPYEGQVLSLDGETGTVLRPSAVGGPAVKVRIKATLAEARSKGFQHPNCRHAVSAYIPGASRTFTTKPNPEGYEATQRQRALERAIRDAKRKQAVAVTPAAKREATSRVKALQAQLKAHVAANDLKRRPQRENITGEHRVEPIKGTKGPEGPMTSGGGKGPTGPDDPTKPRTGGGGGGGDGDDPENWVNPAITGLSDDEIRDMAKGLHFPRYTRDNQPKAVHLYGDEAVSFQNVAAHALYGLQTQKSKRKRTQSGHKNGIMANKKPWFPRNMSDQQVLDLIVRVLEEPDYYRPIGDEGNGNDRRSVSKLIDGNLYSVQWFPKPDGSRVFSAAFPIGGPGIYQWSEAADELGRHVHHVPIDWTKFHAENKAVNRDG